MAHDRQRTSSALTSFRGDRRAFVRSLGAAAALPALTACARAFRIPLDAMVAPKAGAGDVRDPDGTWAEGLAYARWTPSPHNTQPWRLRVASPTEAEVYYDPRRLLPVTDPTGAFTIMGLAMFVEYLGVALRARGVTLETHIREEALDYTATRPRLFASLTFSAEPTDNAPEFDRKLILERKTSRMPYDGRPVENSTMASLEELARGFGNDFAWSSDPKLVEWIIDLNRYTLFADLDDAPSRTELRRWIRTSDDEAARHADGLWSHCLRFPGWLLKAFFDDHDKWGRGWRARVSGEMLVNGMHGTRTVAWWSGPFETPADWIATGRVLGRSWLELTRRGIGLHPFGSVITNATAHARLRERLGMTEGDSRLWLLARLGRSQTPPRSLRVPPEAVLLTDEEVL